MNMRGYRSSPSTGQYSVTGFSFPAGFRPLSPARGRLLAAALAVLALAGCGGGPDRPAPDLILVSLDTTRSDRFDAVAGREPGWSAPRNAAARYAAAASPTPITLPAHTSLLSGLDPDRHGVRNNGQQVPARITLLQERLAAAGYRTAGFVSAFPLDRQFGLARGFGTWDQPETGQTDAAIAERDATTTVARALDWLEAGSTAPDFLFLHLFDAHAPYAAHGLPEDAPAAARYDAEIAAMGRALAPLFARLESRGRPFVVVLTGDHGEGLGDHGEPDHGLMLFDSTLLVPMWWWSPGRIAPGLRDGLPRLVDVAPTLLELAGATPLEGADGVSLLAGLDGRAQEIPPAYAESFYGQAAYGAAPLKSWREGDWKWIGTDGSDGHALFRWTADPGEADNRISAEPARADALQLSAWGRPEPPEPAAVSSEALKTLASLGYVGQGGTVRGSGRPPAEYLPIHAELVAIQELDRRRSLPEAVTRARALALQAPDLPFVQFVLGELLMQSGAGAEAESAFRRTIALNPGDAQAHYRLAELLMGLGRDADSLSHWDAVAAIDPARAMARTNKAVALANLGRWPEAWTSIEPALAAGAPDAGTLQAAVAIAEQTGHWREAAAALRALAAMPGQSVNWLQVGALDLRAGDAAAARESFSRVPRPSPGADLADMGLASAMAMAGDTAGAEQLRAAVAARNPAAHALGLRQFAVRQ